MPADYDDFAEDYAVQNETGFFNAHYEKPEMMRLLGDVAGRRVLDAGCGAGPLALALREAGATVAGFDVSPAMVALARERLGEDADLRVADLAHRLPYDDAAFDDVVASLVLHYLEDWSGPLTELRRVLVGGGRLLVSVNHPAAAPIVRPDDDYFGVVRHSEDHEFNGRTVWLTFFHRPLHAMADAFAGAGFRITGISEPPCAPDTPAHLLPPGLEPGQRFIGFLFFALEAV